MSSKPQFRYLSTSALRLAHDAVLYGRYFPRMWEARAWELSAPDDALGAQWGSAEDWRDFGEYVDRAGADRLTS